ncbi:MAG: hypothetical protein NC044_08925 [Prevotella sp.]|nr:hypothetical protein [Bacteroides sp.]MCM1446510.1 hypothetical protein [Prevotella sp.]
MYPPNTIKLYREGATIYIETQDDTYEHYSQIRGFEELPILLGKKNADVLGENLPGGFQPLPTDTIILSTEGKPGIKFNVQDIEISSFEYADVDDIEVSVNYVITPESSEVITKGNPATQAVQDALFEMGYDFVSFRDIATNSSVPNEYVMLPPNKALYIDDVRVSYKFAIDVNYNLVHLSMTAMKPIQFDRSMDFATTLANRINTDSVSVWVNIDDQFRVRVNTVQRSLASMLSAGTVKAMFNDVKELLIEVYKEMCRLKMISK